MSIPSRLGPPLQVLTHLSGVGLGASPQSPMHRRLRALHRLCPAPHSPSPEQLPGGMHGPPAADTLGGHHLAVPALGRLLARSLHVALLEPSASLQGHPESAPCVSHQVLCASAAASPHGSPVCFHLSPASLCLSVPVSLTFHWAPPSQPLSPSLCPGPTLSRLAPCAVMAPRWSLALAGHRPL